MKVVLLGAGGGMGRMAARHLALTSGVEQLILSDVDAAAAAVTHSTLDAPSIDVRVESHDILEPTSLRKALHDADVVVNCAGPFFTLGVPALETAIDTRTTYIDICDDPAPTAAMLALDERAREAGVGAVIGMGASPGVSNLLALRASRHLDLIEDCYTGWPLDTPSPGSTTDAPDEIADADGRPAAAVIHLMEQISGLVDVVEGGQLVERSPLEPVELHFPGRAPGTGYIVGHPEPVTLLGSLGLTGRSACVMLLRPTTVAYLRRLRDDLDAGRLDHRRAAAAVVKPTAVRSVRALLDGRSIAGHGGLPEFFVLLRGTKDLSPATVGCHLTSAPPGMDAITAIPVVLAVRQLIECALPPGVHAPERVIDPDRLLVDLLPHCQPSVDSLDELAPVSVATGKRS